MNSSAGRFAMRVSKIAALGGAALVLALGAFLVAATRVAEASTVPTGGGTVTPVLECEFANGSPGDAYSAVWGYTNTTGATATVAIGASNEFTPGGTNRGQPTQFSVGTSTDAFTTNWNGSTAQSWVLEGHTATANAVVGGKPAPACGTTPVPIVGPPTLVWLGGGVVAAGLVVVWRRRTATPARAPARLA